MGQVHRKENQQAHRLAYAGCHCSPANSHLESKDEHRLQNDVQKDTAAHANHGKPGPSLGAQQDVQHKGPAHHRRGYQNVVGKVFRIGQDGVGCPQEPHQLRLEKDSQPHHHNSASQGGKEGCGGKAVRLLVFSLPQPAGNQTAGPHPQHKAHRLNHGHDGKDNSHRCTGTGSQLGYKEHIRQPVHGGHQHGDDSGNSHPRHKPGNRRCQHVGEVLMLLPVSFGGVHALNVG